MRRRSSPTSAPRFPDGRTFAGLAAGRPFRPPTPRWTRPIARRCFRRLAAPCRHAGARGLRLVRDGARRWVTRLVVTGVSATGGAAAIEAADPIAGFAVRVDLSLDSGTGVLRPPPASSTPGLKRSWSTGSRRRRSRSSATMRDWFGRALVRRVSATGGALAARPEGDRVAGRADQPRGVSGHLSLSAAAGETGRTGQRRRTSAGVATGASSPRSSFRGIASSWPEILPMPGETVLAPGGRRGDADAVRRVSEAGIGAVSAAFHEEVRRHILRMPRPAMPRPVHFNSWEAVYFELSLPTLRSLAMPPPRSAQDASSSTDGWFPARRKTGRASATGRSTGPSFPMASDPGRPCARAGLGWFRPVGRAGDGQPRQRALPRQPEWAFGSRATTRRPPATSWFSTSPTEGVRLPVREARRGPVGMPDSTTSSGT